MRVVAATVVLIVSGSLIVAKAPRGHGAAEKSVVAAVQLRPEAGSGVRGVAFFRQRGLRLSGWVAVWGLNSRTAHAVHFHGPGTCGGPAADAIAAHRDLVSDGNGVAYLNFTGSVRSLVLKPRVYYNVHRRGAATGKSPSVACGDIRPEG